MSADKDQTEYLGDGVYAAFDGYFVWLETRYPATINRIALEPAVLGALERYVARLSAPNKEQPA